MLDLLKKAKWISAKESQDAPPVFRKIVKLEVTPKSAKMVVTAMGVYEIEINGVRMGKEFYAPGWTMYNKRLQYQTYDVTEYLKSGENIIDIIVAPGWCVGEIGWQGRSRIWASRQALLAYINIDGQEFFTDKNWGVGTGGILNTSFFNGEKYDARLSAGGFTEPVYAMHDYENLVPHEGEPIRIIEEITPVELIHAPNGETLIDFGQNLTGFVKFEVNADAGDVIRFDHAEVLTLDGNFYRDNYRTASTLVEYICKDGKQSWHPHFAFQGFRYIRIIDYPGKLDTIEDAMCFTAAVVHSDMKRTGYFKCSNPMINKLFENIVWGQRGNFLDIPTDCPQRNERCGWTGDAQVFARTASYNYDVEKFFRKWLRDLAACQFPNGGISRVVPDICDPSAPTAAWGDAAVIIPWQMYITYGNKAVLCEQFPSMRAWVEYIRAQGDEECLWNTGEQYGDWVAIDAPCEWEVELIEKPKTGATHPYMIATAYYAYSTKLLIKAGLVLGYDMSEYEDLYERIKVKFIETYYDGDLMVSDTQTAWAIGIYFDLVKDKEFAVKRLAELIRKNGNHLTTGFVGTPYLLHALSDNGEEKLAYTLLLQEDFPSWLYSVKQGATTVWEHWDGMRLDGTMWDAEMNSFNHYSYGAVADWMYQTAAGIAPTEEAPGFKHIKFEPKTDERLESCCASIDTRDGKVAGGWVREGEKIRYFLSVPQGCTAEVHLGGKVVKVNAGEHNF